jgi:hypothetical protein
MLETGEAVFRGILTAETTHKELAEGRLNAPPRSFAQMLVEADACRGLGIPPIDVQLESAAAC